VIVQSDRLQLSTVLVAPTSAHARSAHARSARHRVLIDVEDVQTQVLTEQIHAIDIDQLGPLVARLSPEAMSDIRAAMAWTLEL
jgi:mRNA-degrading endonuclease toxin of MazEF toxin-antitoxin module